MKGREPGVAKTIRLRVGALSALVILLVGLSLPSTSSSKQGDAAHSGWSIGRAQQDPLAIKSARNVALIAATQDVLKETGEIRKLAILRPVQSSTQSRAEIERMLVKNLNEETTPARIHATEATLKKLGLAPADFQYRALMIRLLTEQVAGYYNPKTQQFHLADWIDLDAQKPIMAHELTHALQDQHFNLRRFSQWPKGDSDAEMAAHALIEGDATLTMALYVANNPLRALAFLKSLGASGMPSEELDKAPRALRESLLFPYQQGTIWTRSVYQRGGWNGVSQAFTNLPQSTEQILHPEKYFAHEAPVKVTLPDITLLLNGRRAQLTSNQLPTAHRSLPTAGWRRLDADVNGEWGLYLILDQFLKSPAESRRAAAGWGGDRYAVYEGPKGEVLFACLSTWDTEADAREFFDAYLRRIELRYPGAIELISTIPRGRTTEVDSADRKTFRTSEGTAVIELRGPRVLILEGIPERSNAMSLLKALS